MSASEPVTVLFVDDEPSILRALARISSGKSWTSLCARSGAEAVALMRSQRIDVLVSDIDMPGMSGLELMRIARLEYPNTLRILLTGTGTLERALEAINEGEVSRFFTKPFDVDDLLQSLTDMVTRVLDMRRRGEGGGHADRRAELDAWVESRWPGTLDISRDPEGATRIDVDALRAALAPLGPTATILLKRDP